MARHDDGLAALLQCMRKGKRHCATDLENFRPCDKHCDRLAAHTALLAAAGGSQWDGSEVTAEPRFYLASLSCDPCAVTRLRTQCV